jgi:hypothetical protein
MKAVEIFSCNPPGLRVTATATEDKGEGPGVVFCLEIPAVEDLTNEDLGHIFALSKAEWERIRDEIDADIRAAAAGAAAGGNGGK